MKQEELTAGNVIVIRASAHIRYEAKYAGPWIGCGGDVNVEAGTQFVLVSRRDGSWFCRSQDEQIIKRALELEKAHILAKPNAAHLRSRLLGISGFEIQDKVEKCILKLS